MRSRESLVIVNGPAGLHLVGALLGASLDDTRLRKRHLDAFVDATSR